VSFDNVLAVRGATREHYYVLKFSLVLSIALMVIAAIFIAGLLHRYRWIGYVGLATILYVVADMVCRGAIDVWPAVAAFKL
jgi:predicted tellurium resistance membrane protein TerC